MNPAAPKLTLWYFPFPGRGGAIRDAFRIGHVAFVDEHVEFPRFAAMKAAGELPFGSLPVLVVEDEGGRRLISQSNAILRYVGKRSGLYPSDPLAALCVDEVMDAAEDAFHLIGASIGEPDAQRRAAMRTRMAEERLPLWFGGVERILERSGGSGFLVGDALTVADLKMLGVVDKLTNGSLDGIPPSVMDGFAGLIAWRKHASAVRSQRIG